MRSYKYSVTACGRGQVHAQRWKVVIKFVWTFRLSKTRFVLTFSNFDLPPHVVLQVHKFLGTC